MPMPHDAPLYPELPRYYRNVQLVSVVCETDEENIAKVLPPPLETQGRGRSLFEVKLSHYEETVFGPFNEASILVPARFGDVEGYTFVYIYIDNGPGLAGGRELMGFPKKDGIVRFERDGDRFHVTVDRHGHRLIEMSTDLSKPKQVKRAIGTRIQVRDIPRADGPGIELRQVIRKDFNPKFFTVHESRAGEANVKLSAGPEDPLDKLGDFTVLGGHFQRADFSLEYGQILYTEAYPRPGAKSPLVPA